MIKYLRMSAGLIGLLAIVAAGAMFMGRDATAQTTYFAPCGTLDISTTAPNTPADLSGTFGIGLNTSTCAPFTSPSDLPGQWNSGGLIYFTPNEWTVAKDADIPDGTKVGHFDSKAVLGLFDNGCQTVLSVPFDLFDGTVNRNGPKLEVKPEGQADRLSPMKDNDSDGVPDGAKAWPTYLDKVATKAGMDLSGLIARFVGVNTSSVVGTTVVLNFLVFEPGSTVSDQIVLDPKLGYPAVTILQDPSGAASDEDPVSDFCAPLWTSSMLQGQAGGATFRGNPPDGAYNFVTWANPAPDVDEDGIENGLDPCLFTPNTSGWDPRGALKQTPGDQDGDGMPDDCDPNPTTPSPCNAANGISNSDEDCDGWQNRGDNCALVANPDQKDDDGDGIGDACDTGTITTALNNTVTLDPNTPNGRHLPVCLVKTITIGSGGTPAVADPTQLAPCNPAAVPGQQATPTPVDQTPSPTPVGGGTGGTGGVGGAGGTGIGSLAPTSNSAPFWATMLAAFGVIGVVIGFGLMGSRFLRRRD